MEDKKVLEPNGDNNASPQTVFRTKNFIQNDRFSRARTLLMQKKIKQPFNEFKNEPDAEISRKESVESLQR